MTDILAAGRYAEALFELAHAEKMDETVEEELISFSRALRAMPEIEKFLHNPRFNAAEKNKLLGSVYQKGRAHRMLLDFFAVLLKKNRFGLIHEIAESYKRIADLSQGQATAEIHTAHPLSAQNEARILSRLEKIAGCAIEAEKTIDLSLIGGVVVRMRNKVLDSSIKNRLVFLKKELTKRQTI